MEPSGSLPPPGLAVSILSQVVRFAPTGRKFFFHGIMFRRQYGEMDETPAPDGLEGMWAGPEEIEYIDRHPEATSRGANARRVARGDMCMCLKRGREVLGYQWIARRSACLFCGFDPGYELLFLPLRSHQMFTYDSYTYAAHRRRGYGAVIRRLLHRAMRDAGVREVYTLVAPENTASISITLQSKFEPWRMAYGFRVRNWNRMILGPQPNPQLNRWIKAFEPSTNTPAAEPENWRPASEEHVR